MKNRTLFTILFLILGTALPLIADGPEGAAVYKAKCAMCHGPDGAGQTAMGKTLKLRDLRSDEVQKGTDKELATVIGDGKGKMPAYKTKLSQAEIDALVAFIRALKK